MTTTRKAATKPAAAAPTHFTAEESLALALDPTTPPAILNLVYRAWANEGGGRAPSRDGGASLVIAGATDDRLGDALASNPNTPPDVLAFLATSRTAAFSRNPVAPLLLLEAPNFVELMARSSLPAFLRHADVPAALVEAVAAQAAAQESREEAALHVTLAGEVADDAWRCAVRALFLEQVRHEPKMQKAFGKKLLARMLSVGLAPAWLAVDGVEAGPAAAADPHMEEWAPGEGARESVHNRSLSPQAAPLCRCLGLADAATDAALLAARAWSLGWMDRLGVALNPHSAELPGALPLLADDGNRYVRAAARARLRGEEAGL